MTYRSSLNWDGEQFITGSHQDIGSILENNKRIRETKQSGDLKHVGEIPQAVYDEWLREAYRTGVPIYNKIEKNKFLKRKLAENPVFKVG